MLLCAGIFLFIAFSLLSFRPSLLLGDVGGVKAPGADLAAITSKVEKAVASLRGLEFKSSVIPETMSTSEVRPYFLKLLAEEMSDEEIKAAEKTLVKFGLIPHDLDLKETIVELFVENVGGFYYPKEKRLVLVGQSPFVYQGLWGEVLLAHELTHALTDQHFDLEKFLPSQRGNDDFDLARQAVGEGDATLIMFEYMLRGWDKDAGQVPGLLTMLELSAAVPAPATLKTLPLVFRENLIFPYARGYHFVSRIKEKDGWDAVNRLYQNPPSSTEEILHPEKFLAGNDRAVKVSLPDLSEILGETYQPLDQNTLGELNIAILLIEFLGAEEASKAAVGWAGDEYASYEAEGILIVWLTLWDTAEDAQEFYSAYGHLVVNKYRRENEEGIEQEEGKARLWMTEEDIVLLEKRGSSVIIVEGAKKEFLERLREALWSERQVASQGKGGQR
ncbi:MAG: hypothetical protein AMS15_05675 [Planctomycetes bacterium DG_23]|nr:MAG: hypothetical protein AMS15_05675 [Planctomycetes bacterium DG_23]